MMGVRLQRRASIFRPGEAFFWAGILLCVTVGLVAAGVYESWRQRQWGWCWFFLAGEAGSIAMYIWIVRSWLLWMDQSGEFLPVLGDVESEHDLDGPELR